MCWSAAELSPSGGYGILVNLALELLQFTITRFKTVGYFFNFVVGFQAVPYRESTVNKEMNNEKS